ncbi:MAG: hypothetical protein IJ112_08275 [Oscillospiraceae bacterium]|nr:hypothetical protein [Oscillospiraceae bacterium]
MISIYPYVLYTILCYPAISPEALLMLHDREATVYSAVRKGLSCGHIAEHKLKNGQYTTRSLLITPGGVHYLINDLYKRGVARTPEAPFFKRGYPESWGWLLYMNLRGPDPLRFRVPGVGTESLLRVCGCSNANLFFALTIL